MDSTASGVRKAAHPPPNTKPWQWWRYSAPTISKEAFSMEHVGAWSLLSQVHGAAQVFPESVRGDDPSVPACTSPRQGAVALPWVT